MRSCPREEAGQPDLRGLDAAAPRVAHGEEVPDAGVGVLGVVVGRDLDVIAPDVEHVNGAVVLGDVDFQAHRDTSPGVETSMVSSPWSGRAVTTG